MKRNNTHIFYLNLGTLLTIFSVSFLFSVKQAQAQSDTSSDDLFKLARQSAFDKKDYSKAIYFSKRALEKSPDYSEIRVFLGRIYTWSDKNDSARKAFSYVLEHHPDDEEAASAFTDLEYWNDNNDAALQYCNQGLKFHPESEALLLKKAKILNNMKQYMNAYSVADSVIQLNPKNEEARSLLNSIIYNSSKYEAGLSYDYVYFDKQFADPWQLISISCSRSTGFGSVIARLNYANRFATNGFQGEVDAYPHISKVFYAYLNFGISGTNSVFPRYRAGASLYANLPWSLEADAGFRYLRFSSDVWIYTASIGKYYKNFWFNFRTYLIPDLNKLSHSYTLTVRYYNGGADDYFSLAIGTGISPDNRANSILLETDDQLDTKKLGIGYSHVFCKLNTIGLGITWHYDEYRTATYGSQWNAGISYQRKF